MFLTNNVKITSLPSITGTTGGLFRQRSRDTRQFVSESIFVDPFDHLGDGTKYSRQFVSESAVVHSLDRRRDADGSEQITGIRGNGGGDTANLVELFSIIKRKAMRSNPFEFTVETLSIGDRIPRGRRQAPLLDDRIDLVVRQGSEECLPGRSTVQVFHHTEVSTRIFDVPSGRLVQREPISRVLDDQTNRLTGLLGYRINVILPALEDFFLFSGVASEREKSESDAVRSVDLRQEILLFERCDVVMHRALGEGQRVGEFRHSRSVPSPYFVQ